LSTEVAFPSTKDITTQPRNASSTAIGFLSATALRRSTNPKNNPGRRYFYGMKIIFLFLLIAQLPAQSLPAQPLLAQALPAQALPPQSSNPCCMPANGYWQVITNDKDPRSVTIKYYDLQDHLLYQEHLTGVSIDCHKKRICRALNSRLKAALKLSAAII
jgi:hypothetical protein